MERSSAARNSATRTDTCASRGSAPRIRPRSSAPTRAAAGASGAGAATSYDYVINGKYDFYYQNSYNTNGTTPPVGQHLINSTAFKSQMTVPAFVGCNSGNAFPAALPGTLLDPDTLVAVAKGVNYSTRNKSSPSPLQPHYDATSGAPPACSDPI